jgi:hypothetical protein
MIVAEHFSRLLDPVAEKPLAFDYHPLSDDEDAAADAEQATEGSRDNESNDIEPEERSPSEKKRRRKKKVRILSASGLLAALFSLCSMSQTGDDPDALYFANGEEAKVADDYLSGDDVDASDDELVAYDLEDDESDLSEVKIPVYLRDVLAGTPNLQFVWRCYSYVLRNRTPR